MNRLKELRQEKKLSQKELAENIGVHYRTLQNWENGESQIKSNNAKQLADYFGVSVGYLLGYSEEPKSVDKIESKLLMHKQYILKLNNIEIEVIKQSDNMSAQNLSDIKKEARKLYETLVWLQYEAEQVEG